MQPAQSGCADVRSWGLTSLRWARFNQLRKVDAKNLEKIANYDVFLSLVRKSSPHRQHALPTQKVRVAIAKHVLPSSIFEYSTTLCVFLNVFFLALYHPGRMSDEMQALYDMQNNIFFALMVLEAGLIIAGKGWFNYLEDRWNWIDIVSIIATFVAFFLPESAFIRSFRLVKILRIIKNVKALQASSRFALSVGEGLGLRGSEASHIALALSQHASASLRLATLSTASLFAGVVAT
eukprot:926729-Rhodomonas_salina.2